MSDTGSTKNAIGLEAFYDDTPDPLFRAQRVFVAFLQGLFAKRPAGRHRWLPNDEETEILIVGQSPEVLTTPHKRPVISVVRGAASWMGTSQSGVLEESMLNYDWKFTDMVASTVTINCLAKLPVEAQKIAWITFLALRIFKRLIQRYGQVHGLGQQMQLGPVGPPIGNTAFSDWAMVQVHVPFFVQEVISISDNDPNYQILLRDLTIAVKTTLE